MSVLQWIIAEGHSHRDAGVSRGEDENIPTAVAGKPLFLSLVCIRAVPNPCCCCSRCPQKVKRLKERNEALLNCVRVLSQKLERTGQTLPAEVAKILSADPSDA